MARFRFFNNTPPEVGISKEEARASVRTDFIGFFMTYGRKFWNISNLNLIIALYVVLFAFGVWTLSPYPLFFYLFLGLMALLFGPLSAGVAYVTRGYVRGDPVYLLADFRYAIKTNWKQAILLGLLDLLVVFMLIYDVFYWSNMDFDYFASLPAGETVVETYTSFDEGETKTEDEALPAETPAAASAEDTHPASRPQSFLHGVFFYGSLFLLLIYAFMRMYLYLLLVTFKLSFFKIVKNAFIFAFVGAARNFAAAFGILLFAVANFAIFTFMPMVGILLTLIITLASMAFVGAYATYPVIKKYMITPFYPDEEVNEAYDSIFKDRE